MSNDQAYIDASAELQLQQAEALAEERKAFVREAAIRLLAMVDQSGTERNGFACLALTTGEAWSLAVQLWDAKPEDC